MQKDPNQEEINFVLNLLSLNKLEEAKKEITKKMLQYKKSSILFNLLGAVLANQKNFDEAIENYQKSIEINPKYAQAYNNLGIVFHKKNKIEEAIENYKKAINLKNNFPEAFNNLGSAVRDSQKKKEEDLPPPEIVPLNEAYLAFNRWLDQLEDIHLELDSFFQKGLVPP